MNIFRKLMMKRALKGTGLFLVHGFLESGAISYNGIPEKLRSMGLKDFFLADIQGHGKGENLNDFDADKALERVEKQYMDYKVAHKRTYLIGFSMGGAIAGHLASKYGADKLVMISPAFKYGVTSAIKNEAMEFFRGILKRPIEDLSRDVKEGGLDVKEMTSKFIDSSTAETTLKLKQIMLERTGKLKLGVFINFTKLIAKIKKTMGTIESPTRIYMSTTDPLVPLDSGDYAFELVTNSDKRLMVISDVNHNIIQSRVGKDILNDIGRFLFGRDVA
jgi:carboxylesterase